MKKLNELDYIGDKIINLFNKMAGVSAVLAAIFATVVIGAKKNIMHPMLFIMTLVALFLTVVVFRGYLRGIIDMIPNEDGHEKSKKGILLSYFIATLISLTPYVTIIVVTHSLI